MECGLNLMSNKIGKFSNKRIRTQDILTWLLFATYKSQLEVAVLI